MDYQEFGEDHQKQLLRDQIRGQEQQHFAQSLDVKRYQHMLDAYARGEFKHEDEAFMRGQKAAWEQSLKVARGNVRVLEASLRDARSRLDAYAPEPGAADEIIG